MLLYLFTICIVIFFCFFAQQLEIQINVLSQSQKNNIVKKINYYYLIVVCWLIIVSGCRYYIGTDFGAYYYYYNIFVESVWKNIWRLNEPGFGLIAKIAMMIHDDGTTVLLCTSVVTIGLAMLVIKRQTDHLVEAVLLYLFLECWHESFNAVRQCLAVTFVFCGFNSLKVRNLKKYILFVFIGFLCHKSACVMILAYLLVHRPVNLKNIILLVILTLSVLESYDLLFSFQNYVLNNSIIKYGYVTNHVNILRVMANVSPALFVLICKPQKASSKNDFLINLILMHASISIAASASTYFARMMMYSAPFVCIALPEILKEIKPSISNIARLAILFFFCIFWLYDLYISPALNPFRFVWNAR